MLKNESMEMYLETILRLSEHCVFPYKWCFSKATQGILLDDGNTHIVYDGAEYIPVACGKTSVDLRSVAVLKKMCSPAQQFVFVQDFVKRENGEYCRDIIEETVDFHDAAELFEGLTGRRIEEATPTNCVIQSKGEAEM